MTTPDVLRPLLESGIAAIRHKLDDQPLHPHVFDEIAIFASCLHKACTALDPVLNLPRPMAPLAPSPQTEGYGATMAREIIAGFKNLGSSNSPKMSPQDLVAAIALAQKEGMTEEVAHLRHELYGAPSEIPDEDLPPKAKVDRANELLAKAKGMHERSKALLGSIKDHEIADALIDHSLSSSSPVA
jgi:hypothetical protein